MYSSRSFAWFEIVAFTVEDMATVGSQSDCGLGEMKAFKLASVHSNRGVPDEDREDAML